MSADLDRLLRDAAATPAAEVDVDALHARAGRARRRGRAVVATFAVALVAVAAVGSAIALRGEDRVELGPAEAPSEASAAAQVGWPLRLRADAVVTPPGASGVPVVLELEGAAWDDWLAVLAEAGGGLALPSVSIVTSEDAVDVGAGDQTWVDDAPFALLERAAQEGLARVQPGPGAVWALDAQPWWRATSPAHLTHRLPHPLLRPWVAEARGAFERGEVARPVEPPSGWEQQRAALAARFALAVDDLAVHRWEVAADGACDTPGDPGCVITITVLALSSSDVPLLVEVEGGGWSGRLEVSHMESRPPAERGATGVDAVALVGLWEVHDAGEEPETILKLDAGSLGLLRPCGPIWGGWDADSAGLFVAGSGGSWGWHGPCGDDDPGPSWLEAVAAHRPDGDGHLLLDAGGAVVARLVPGEEPTLPDTVSQSVAVPPFVTDATRRALAPSAPLPGGLVPATAAALAGRWIPDDAPAGSEAHAELLADGWWRGSDGCNGLAGRWRAGPEGALLAVGGGSHNIGCENLPVQERLERTARAGFDGDTLVLVDRQGDEVGRFQGAGSRGQHAELPEEPEAHYGCGTGYPAATWAGEQPLTALDHPGREHLVAELRLDDLTDWFVIDAAEEHLTVARLRELPSPGGDDRTHEVAAVALVEGDWMLMESSNCTPQLLLDGLGSADLWLLGEQDPAATHIDIVLNERACANGESAEGRIEVVRLVERADAVEVVLGVVPYGSATCPSNPSTTVRLPLSAPLGERTVIDASVLPPRPLEIFPADLQP